MAAEPYTHRLDDPQYLPAGKPLFGRLQRASVQMEATVGDSRTVLPGLLVRSFYGYLHT
jgi:hypothetical protein